MLQLCPISPDQVVFGRFAARTPGLAVAPAPSSRSQVAASAASTAACLGWEPSSVGVRWRPLSAMGVVTQLVTRLHAPSLEGFECGTIDQRERRSADPPSCPPVTLNPRTHCLNGHATGTWMAWQGIYLGDVRVGPCQVSAFNTCCTADCAAFTVLLVISISR